MSPLIDRAAMESAFGADELFTLDDRTLSVIAHAPTRAFLRDIGLPSWGLWFEADQRLIDGDLEVGGEGWRTFAEKHPSITFDMSAWLTLGGFGMDDFIVDTVTGVVYCAPENHPVQVLNSSVDTLAFFLHALELRRPEYDPEIDCDEDLGPGSPEDDLLALMRRTEPALLEKPDCYWHVILHYVEKCLMFY